MIMKRRLFENGKNELTALKHENKKDDSVEWNKSEKIMTIRQHYLLWRIHDFPSHFDTNIDQHIKSKQKQNKKKQDVETLNKVNNWLQWIWYNFANGAQIELEGH